MNLFGKLPRFESPACFGYDTELFYAYDSQREKDYRMLAKAREICAGCPERLPCLEYALKNERDGIWGGLLPIERRAVVRARKKAENDYSRATT